MTIRAHHLQLNRRRLRGSHLMHHLHRQQRCEKTSDQDSEILRCTYCTLVGFRTQFVDGKKWLLLQLPLLEPICLLRLACSSRQRRRKSWRRSRKISANTRIGDATSTPLRPSAMTQSSSATILSSMTFVTKDSSMVSHPCAKTDGSHNEEVHRSLMTNIITTGTGSPTSLMPSR